MKKKKHFVGYAQHLQTTNLFEQNDEQLQFNVFCKISMFLWNTSTC